MTAAAPPRRGIAEEILERRWPVTVAFVLLILGLWQLYASGDVASYVLGPVAIGAAIVEFAQTGELWGQLATSLRRSFLGYGLGAGLGLILGLIAGGVRSVGDLVDLPVSFTYPLPKIALFPVFAVWLGFTDITRVLVISLACFYPAYLNALSGTRAIDPNLIWVARNAGAHRLRTFIQVVFPAALPRAFAGLQISLAISFILLFATETIGFSDGLGSDIFRSFQNGLYPRMYAGIAVLGIVGFLANALLVRLTMHLTRGRMMGGPTGA